MLETLLGGAIALAGVALAQWAQSIRARQDAAQRRDDEKEARLRASYHEVVSAAEWLRARAFEMMELSDQIKSGDEQIASHWGRLDESNEPISAARASLLLEADEEDRAVLHGFRAVSAADASFKVALIMRTIGASDEEKRTELFNAMSELEMTVDEVSKLARGRLAGLEPK